jgi:hypothetical protein
MGSLPVVTLLDQYTVKIRLNKDPTVGNQAGFKDEEYQFDSCFGANTTQEQIFEDSKMLMQSAVDGFNVCIFAYGQTGSGKTFTIQGDESNIGLVPRGLQELYQIRRKLGA